MIRHSTQLKQQLHTRSARSLTKTLFEIVNREKNSFFHQFFKANWLWFYVAERETRGDRFKSKSLNPIGTNSRRQVLKWKNDEWVLELDQESSLKIVAFCARIENACRASRGKHMKVIENCDREKCLGIQFVLGAWASDVTAVIHELDLLLCDGSSDIMTDTEPHCSNLKSTQ